MFPIHFEMVFTSWLLLSTLRRRTGNHYLLEPLDCVQQKLAEIVFIFTRKQRREFRLFLSREKRTVDTFQLDGRGHGQNSFGWKDVTVRFREKWERWSIRDLHCWNGDLNGQIIDRLHDLGLETKSELIGTMRCKSTSISEVYDCSRRRIISTDMDQKILVL